jgi:hypothetical protein
MNPQAAIHCAARTGAFIGNFPQAFSHIGLVSGDINLARSLCGGER